MKRAALILTAFALLFGGVGRANAAIISSLFNTGQDNNHQTLAYGSIGLGATVDPHYSLVSVPNGSTTNIAVWGAAWFVDGTNSAWIAPNQAAQFTAEGAPQGDYVYHTTFDLTGFNPSTASITGKWSADNYGADILINNVSTGQFTGASLGDANSLLAWSNFSITSGFLAGINTLDFKVHNFDGPGDNPIGLRVEITQARADETAAVPEPATIIIWSLLGVVGIRLTWWRKRAR